MPVPYHSRSILLPVLLLMLSVGATVAANENDQEASASKTLWSWSLLGDPKTFGPAPLVPEGPLSEEVARALDVAFGENLQAVDWGDKQDEALRTISRSRDPRLAWIISDFMRIAGRSGLMGDLASVATELLGEDLRTSNPWGDTTDYLIAWRIPSPPGFVARSSAAPRRYRMRGRPCWLHRARG